MQALAQPIVSEDASGMSNQARHGKCDRLRSTACSRGIALPDPQDPTILQRHWALLGDDGPGPERPDETARTTVDGWKQGICWLGGCGKL
jgi:hypothetical protein